VFGGWTRGFRQFAPHFGVTHHAYGVVVPSQLLDPVTADQFELGLKYRSPRISADAAAYYTRFENFQNVVRSTFQGQDWYDFDADGTRDADEDVFVTSGNGKAYVYGVEVSAKASLAWLTRGVFGQGWSLGAGFMYNYGQDETNDIPLRHTHPTRGTLKLRYERPNTRTEPWFEIATDFVNDYSRIPPSRLSGDVGYLEDPQDPTSGMRRTWGLPGYTVVDVRAGVKLFNKLTVVIGVDNVFDTLYRPAHARWDAPGRSIHTTFELEL
jgi:outer membrane receptor protein involved in Fe transport